MSTEYWAHWIRDITACDVTIANQIHGYSDCTGSDIRHKRDHISSPTINFGIVSENGTGGHWGLNILQIKTSTNENK